MDPNLCIDPSLLSQFLEEDEVSTLLVDVATSGTPSSRASPLEIFANSTTINRRKELNAAPTLPNIILQEEHEHLQLQQQQQQQQHRQSKTLADKKATFLAENLQEAKDKFLSPHEQEFGLKFVTRKCPKNFGLTDWKGQILSKKKIYFDQQRPFIKASLNSLVMECPFGPDHDLIKKEQRKRSRVNYDENEVKATDTKKIGCPVKFVFEERIYFPDFEGHKNRDKLKRKLNDRDFEGLGQIRRKIFTSHFSEHSHKNRKDEIYFDPFIKKLVWKGVQNPDEIRIHLARILHDGKAEKSLPKTEFVERRRKIVEEDVKTFIKEQEKLRLFAEKLREKYPDDLFEFRPFKRVPVKGQTEEDQCFFLDENDRISGKGSKSEAAAKNGAKFIPVIKETPEIDPESDDFFFFLHQSRGQKRLFDSLTDAENRVIFLDVLESSENANLTIFVLLTNSDSVFRPLGHIFTHFHGRISGLKASLEILNRERKFSFRNCLVSSADEALLNVVESAFNCESAIIAEKARKAFFRGRFGPSSALERSLEALSECSTLSDSERLKQEVKKRDDPDGFWTRNWLNRTEKWCAVLAPIKYLDAMEKKVVKVDKHEVTTCSMVAILKKVTAEVKSQPPMTVHGESEPEDRVFRCLRALKVGLKVKRGQEGTLVFNQMMESALNNLLPLLSDETLM